MGERAPRKEQGITKTPEAEGGSVEDFLTEIEAKTHGVERVMQGISEVANTADSIKKLGVLGDKYPEMSNWVDRKVAAMKNLVEKAKQGQDVKHDVGEWGGDVNYVSRIWKGGNVEMDVGRKELFGSLKLLRTEVQKRKNYRSEKFTMANTGMERDFEVMS